MSADLKDSLTDLVTACAWLVHEATGWNAIITDPDQAIISAAEFSGREEPHARALLRVAKLARQARAQYGLKIDGLDEDHGR